MRQIKLLLIVLIGIQSLIAQKRCSFDDLLKKTLIEEIKYKKYTTYLNLNKALNHKEIDFIGCIGSNKKRLRLTFDFIDKDKDDLNCYLVGGITTVSNLNKRKFAGEFNLVDSFVFTEPLYAEEIASEKYGFSIFDFRLLENQQESSTGIFEGKIVLLWKRNNNEADYEDIFEGYDGNRNYQFLGTWTSYKTGKSSHVAWGQYRIPCAGDLDIGASEFMPNEKYYKYGWADYKP